ncbi:MAG: HAMP domain-containing histidine kinase [Propionibacteriaceae bacterium]|jgi:signal transduction histidine kinase|nr:HAMP domain-containing histidine kinase [Propionibacteriaceae bacterium]
MMSRIWLRLLAAFLAAFIVFTAVAGVTFFVIFSRYSAEIHRAEMEQTAIRIAENLAPLLEASPGSDPPGHGHGQGQGEQSGLGSYLRFLDAIALSEVWVVNKDLSQITSAHHAPITYRDLPAGAETVIETAMAGKTAFSEVFGDLLGAPTITVAAPILTTEGNVVGVVLLHQQINTSARTTASLVTILAISSGAAIVLTLVVASLLARRFTKPLSTMKAVSARVASGDYSARIESTRRDEIGDLARALDTMTAQLEAGAEYRQAREQAQRAFMATISHELRTPVTVIRASLEALSDGVVTERAKVADYHQQMLVETAFLERLVNDLLELARLQNPDFTIEKTDLDFVAVVTDAVRGLQTVAEARQIPITFDPTSLPTIRLSGDYDRLRQMLRNVLDNAIKFSPPGTPVAVSLSQHPTGFVLTVRDRGPGIAPSALPQVFDRFHRQSSEDNPTGTGLGLAITKQIADRHDIAVRIDSTVGEGTIVEFRLSRSNPT